MTLRKSSHHFERSVNIAIHLVAWLYIFSTPLLLIRPGEGFSWGSYGRQLFVPLTTCFIFYANYFWLVPHYIIHRRIKWFITWNLLFIASLTLLRECFIAFNPPPLPPGEMPGGKMGMFPRVPPHFNLIMMLRSCFTTIFSAGLAVAVRLSVQWKLADEKRKEAELGRTEAELQNLKNQISPHFLLNTLNNIYALTAIDSEKAQEAILSLSRMLRYLLYENQNGTVALSKETDFLRTYIRLMQLRVAKDVDIRYDISIPQNENLQVTPLIFISLLENAFKHGISASSPCFIHIRLSVNSEKGLLTFSVSNSHHPKSSSDKTGSGIGLQQVRSRLLLSYPERHTWEYGVSQDGRQYVSTIKINYKEASSQNAKSIH